RPQVGGGQPVAPQNFAAGGVDVFPRVGKRHLVDARGREQAPGVVAEAEDHRPVGGLVAADALEHRGAVVQRVGHDMGGRLGPGLDRPVVPDPLGVLHGDAPWGPAIRAVAYFAPFTTGPTSTRVRVPGAGWWTSAWSRRRGSARSAARPAHARRPVGSTAIRPADRARDTAARCPAAAAS